MIDLVPHARDLLLKTAVTMMAARSARLTRNLMTISLQIDHEREASAHRKDVPTSLSMFRMFEYVIDCLVHFILESMTSHSS